MNDSQITTALKYKPLKAKGFLSRAIFTPFLLSSDFDKNHFVSDINKVKEYSRETSDEIKIEYKFSSARIKNHINNIIHKYTLFGSKEFIFQFLESLIIKFSILRSIQVQHKPYNSNSIFISNKSFKYAINLVYYIASLNDNINKLCGAYCRIKNNIISYLSKNISTIFVYERDLRKSFTQTPDGKKYFDRIIQELVDESYLIKSTYYFRHIGRTPKIYMINHDMLHNLLHKDKNDDK